MFLSKQEKISAYNRRIINKLADEKQKINYEKRWSELKEFRSVMSKYVEGYNKNGDSLTPKLTILSNGHVLDHHVIGYFAPMEFKRWGFKNPDGTKEKRSPVEQIEILNQYFKEHGIRFIYVPIPCKVAVDPEIAVEQDVLPDDRLVIPQWRQIIFELACKGIELIDCYSMLKKAGESTFTKNHYISPIGAKIIAEAVADYINDTTEYPAYLGEFICRDEVIGSTVMLNSGNNNSIEIGAEYFETTRTFFKDDLGQEKPYLGRRVNSKIGVIGDCNLQNYRGIGIDVTAQIVGRLNYPIEYIGRYLPYAKNDSIEKLPKGSLYGKSIIVYIGFVSGSFVRAVNNDDIWCTNLPLEDVFIKN